MAKKGKGNAKKGKSIGSRPAQGDSSPVSECAQRDATSSPAPSTKEESASSEPAAPEVIDAAGEPAVACEPAQRNETADEISQLRAENAQLRQALEEKGLEIQELRAQLTSAQGEVAVAEEDMAVVHERLKSLRKDQAGADAARERAWEELKRVVAEVADLAGNASLAPGSDAATGLGD